MDKTPEQQQQEAWKIVWGLMNSECPELLWGHFDKVGGTTALDMVTSTIKTLVKSHKELQEIKNA